MDIELLRTFLELNRTRHFRRAAEALHFTQAAISSRLKNLETQLGVTLFERSSREMRLTSEGARLVPHAQKLVAAWRLAQQDVSLAGAEEQLVIGGSLHLWDVLVQDWIHKLRASKPEMGIIGEMQSPDVLTRSLIDGNLDVAIMLEPSQLEIMQIQEIATIEFVCVSTRKNQDIDQVLTADYIYVDWGLAHGLDHRRAFPDAPVSMTRLSEARMAVKYMLAHGGSAYLPNRMIKNYVENGQFHQVKHAPTFLRQAFATYAVRSARLELIQNSLESIGI